LAGAGVLAGIFLVSASTLAEASPIATDHWDEITLGLPVVGMLTGLGLAVRRHTRWVGIAVVAGSLLAPFVVAAVLIIVFSRFGWD
jgi:hypothetical protein